MERIELHAFRMEQIEKLCAFLGFELPKSGLITSPCGCGSKFCRTCHFFELVQRVGEEALKDIDIRDANQTEDLQHFRDFSKAILSAYKAGYEAGMKTTHNP